LDFGLWPMPEADHVGGSVARHVVDCNRHGPGWLVAMATAVPQRLTLHIERAQKARLHAALMRPAGRPVIAAIDQEIASRIAIQIPDANVTAERMTALCGQIRRRYGHFAIEERVDLRVTARISQSREKHYAAALCGWPSLLSNRATAV
jgi:hypothetical protein